MRHQEKLEFKEIFGNFVVQILRLVDFLPDLVDVIGESSLNTLAVVFLCTEVAQDEENFFSGVVAE